jgi:hypothetical protein
VNTQTTAIRTVTDDIDCFPFGQYYKYFPPPHKVEQSAAGSVNSPVCRVIPGGSV